MSLFAEQNDLMFAVPGGLIGVGTKVDPTLCRADRLAEGAVNNIVIMAATEAFICNYFIFSLTINLGPNWEPNQDDCGHKKIVCSLLV